MESFFIIEGKFWINEQDPYEPRAVMCKNSDGQFDLSDILIGKFGIKLNMPYSNKKLKITIEEMD